MRRKNTNNFRDYRKWKNPQKSRFLMTPYTINGIQYCKHCKAFCSFIINYNTVIKYTRKVILQKLCAHKRSIHDNNGRYSTIAEGLECIGFGNGKKLDLLWLWIRIICNFISYAFQIFFSELMKHLPLAPPSPLQGLS